MRRTILFASCAFAMIGAANIAAAQETPPSPPPPPPPAAPPADVASPPPAQVAVPQGPPMAQPPLAYAPPPVFGPSRLPYREGDPIPPGYTIELRPRYSLATAGVATFAPLYGMSVLLAGSFVGSEERTSGNYVPLFIPVIGPFVTIGTTDAEGPGTLLLMLDGLGQATGAALILAGMFSDQKFISRTASGFDPRPDVMVGPRAASLRWHF